MAVNDDWLPRVIYYEQDIQSKPVCRKKQLFRCLANYCESNDIISIYQSDECFLIESFSFSKLKELLSKEYPDVSARYNVHYQEIMDFGFESNESLSHFLLSWS